MSAKFRGLSDLSVAVPAKCGCLNFIGGEIQFCPLHKAAPELVEALRDIIHDYKANTYAVRISDEAMARLVKAEALLRKVTA